MIRNMHQKTLIFVGIIILAGIGLAAVAWHIRGGRIDPQNAIASKPSDGIDIPILIYHSIAPHFISESPLVLHYTVTPDAFDGQLKYLRDNRYNVITLDMLVGMIASGTTPPPKSVVITFDDGWEDQYRDAFPILKKYHDPATFFIFTNGPDSDEIDFLTWDQIKEMSDAGMDIESHSVSHPYLFRITDKNVLWHEIADSKTIIENHIGKPVNLFAYPFGFYNALDITILKAAGYVAARTDLPGEYQNTTSNLFGLDGSQVTDNFGRFVRDIH